MMAPAAPRWTRKRLEAMLGTCYGRTPTGHVDTAAVANTAGVSVRTVQRWMAGSNRQNAAIPHTRLLQLCRPPADTQERSQQAADYASEAITKILSAQGARDPSRMARTRLAGTARRWSTRITRSSASASGDQ